MAGWLGTSQPSMNDKAPQISQMAAGAANGKRCRPNSVSTARAIAGTSHHKAHSVGKGS